ncbi:Hsp70 family protein [Saccharospirillum salsuginis]|uniref:Heat-shock protein n=1 Tax=Saccharospirillum salsuginis TaxID=418750 RepID=A0A918ND42_9GAMM|nr:Hsp70 family protein [Saccharospirillum salsuginis]GGX59235.1 heat-shock protein [Saccharospirillum salsuginis]
MICGLDFGTSNSTVGVFKDGRAQMVPLEYDPRTGQQETTLPSALFFDFETNDIHFGRRAIAHYTQGEFGRLMRSMKSILGTRQMDEGTQIKTRVYSFNDIIGFFVQSLKERAEAFAGKPLTHVVLGRPVHFSDNHPELDQAAEARMADIAHKVGFQDVSFQYEPIAAAYDYEQQVDGEELALIIDVGGGTSDFTLIRLAKSRSQLADRSSDILANHGVHIGGTDFDRNISLATVMPLLGMNVCYKDKPTLSMPRHYFVDLATWHRIHWLYEPKVLRDIADLRLQMREREPIDRLMTVLKNKAGHRLAGEVERAKIDLSQVDETQLDLSFLLEAEDGGPQPTATQATMNEAIADDVNRVFRTVDETLVQSGLGKSDIQTIFTTGGSTALPTIRSMIQSRFPDAKWVSGDLYNSVGKGLALEARRRYL